MLSNYLIDESGMFVFLHICWNKIQSIIVKARWHNYDSNIQPSWESTTFRKDEPSGMPAQGHVEHLPYSTSLGLALSVSRLLCIHP